MIGLRFFPLKSADVRGAGTLDKALRTSAWEARLFVLRKAVPPFSTCFYTKTTKPRPQDFSVVHLFLVMTLFYKRFIPDIENIFQICSTLAGYLE